MSSFRLLRYGLIVLALLAGVVWSGVSAEVTPDTYPTDLLVDAAWLKERLNDKGVVIFDVRTDKHHDGKCIPGAVRLPWREFRHNDRPRGLGGVFVGTGRAERIFSNHGLTRSDTVVLYDDVERDGGATASYVFWVLDLLGHEKIRILERGMDGWIDAGYATADKPREPEAMYYEAQPGETRLRRLADGDFIYRRLGDPYCQIVDSRGRDEYIGSKPNTGLDGDLLKAGHIPGAVNVPYGDGWADESKKVKSYSQLRRLFRGLDPDKAVITYCSSARRGSFNYFLLRLMGFEDVILYDNSWFEWGAPDNYFPVEKTENPMQGALPGAVRKSADTSGGTCTANPSEAPAGGSGDSSDTGSGSGDGYVSCGG